jgi:hypothetical protein
MPEGKSNYRMIGRIHIMDNVKTRNLQALNRSFTSKLTADRYLPDISRNQNNAERKEAI